ncbi:MAG: CHAD domain-containing protein [Candidatus Binataceae bacterium]|nr:CHAD domain-containing protein [Candidatus Binataceae bacterium]
MSRHGHAIDPGAPDPRDSLGVPPVAAEHARTVQCALSATDTCAAAACAVLRAGVEAMRLHQAAAIAGEVEPLHQMRVATRRLRAAVALFAGAIHGSRARVYRSDLPWLGRAAGAVRECDVIAAMLDRRGARLSPDLAAAMPALMGAIAERRALEHGRFVAILAARRYRLACARLSEPLVRRVDQRATVGLAAPAMIAPIARAVSRCGRRLERDASPLLFHRLRVRLKRLRYGLEILPASGGKRVRKAAARLAAMQELLGQHQDLVAAIGWLHEYATADNAPPAAILTAGALLQSFGERREKLAARSCKRWRRVVRSRVLDEALEEIAREARRMRAVDRQAHRQREIDRPGAVPHGALDGISAMPGATSALGGSFDAALPTSDAVASAAVESMAEVTVPAAHPAPADSAGGADALPIEVKVPVTLE